MLEEHAKLMTMFHFSDEIIGRKKLQKMVYILKKLDFPFTEKYQFHFYGPYSEELTLKIEEMCNLGFIHELKESKGNYNQYRYHITSKGEDFLSHYDFHLPTIESCVSELNNKPSRFLELVSTILYFDYLDDASCIDKVRTVKRKQKFTDQEFNQAFHFIQKLLDMKHLTV